MEENKILLCHLCKVALKPQRIYFEYLGLIFHADVLKCLECGHVFIPEILVEGRMADVEKQLEDK